MRLSATTRAATPPVTEVNVRALRERDPDHIALSRYDEIARLITGHENASASDAVQWLGELGHDLQIPPLSAYGISREDFPVIVEKSQRASSMKGNPIMLTADELTAILEKAL